MPWFRTHRKPRPGQQLTARDVRKLAETADWSSRIRAAAPLSIVAGAAGPLLRYAGPIFGAYVGKTVGTVTARSGSTPGSGVVALQTWNSAILQPLGVNFTAYNIAGTPSTGIPDGKYCVILKIAGDYWIIFSECA